MLPSVLGTEVPVFFLKLMFLVHWEDLEGSGGEGGGRGDRDGEHM